jgi:hypothetical protein
MCASAAVKIICRTSNYPSLTKHHLHASHSQSNHFQPLVTDISSIISHCLPYTCVSRERLAAWVDDLAAAVRADVPGDVIECGVFRGGCVFAAAMVLDALGDTTRHVYAADTFRGMTSPGPIDIDHRGQPAAKLLASAPPGTGIWCECSLDDFQANLLTACPYSAWRVRVIVGDCLHTLPAQAPATLCALRIDLDWSNLVAHALDVLAPRLSPGAAPIHIDDYGHWQGARLASERWALAHSATIRPIDYTGARLIRPL